MLVRKVHKHLVRTYVKYLGTAAVKNDRKAHKKVRSKGEGSTRKLGRPFIDLVAKGHRVRVSGDKQFCDRRGRITGAKAKHTSWVTNSCEELEIQRKSKAKGHRMYCDKGQWTCRACGVRGRTLGNIACKGATEPGSGVPEPKRRKSAGLSWPD